MIDKKEVQHIASLARLGLEDKEIKKIQKDLSSILDYMEKLKEVDIMNVGIYFSTSDVENTTRDDEDYAKEKKEVDKLLKLAPDIQKGYLKTKQIL